VRVTARKLSENLFAILDRAIETGVGVEVIRKGKILRIVPEVTPDKLSRMKKRKCIIGDPNLAGPRWTGYRAMLCSFLRR
jgi:hypothetical protein